MRSAHRLALAGLILVGACADSSGSSDAIDVDRLPWLEAHEELRIGHVDDPDIGFSRIGSVTVDDAGNVYVVEWLDRQVRVYDAAGNRLHTFGGPGEGPGEFRAPGALGIIDDTLWVSDGRLSRITLFSLAGEALRTIRQPAVSVEPVPGVTIRIAGSSYLGNGLLRGITSGGSWADELPEDTLEAPRLVFDESGTIVDTLGHRRLVMDFGRQVDVGGHTIFLSPQRALEDGPLHIDAEDAFYVVERPIASSAERGVFTLIRTNEDRDTLFLRRYRYTPREYPPGFADSLASVIAGRYRSSRPVDLELLERAARDAIQLPPYMPAIFRYRTGEDGTIWLQREDVPGPTARWLLIEPDGEPVGRLELPRNVDIRWNRGDIIWAVVPDDLDVPWLVRFRFETS